MAEHVEDDAAALGFAVVPGRPLRGLPVALEHPVAEIALDREDAPEEARLDQRPELQEPGQPELVLDDAVPDPGGLGGAIEGERVREVLRDRLLAIDVLAGGDRALQQAGAQPGRGGIEEQLVVGVGKGGVEVQGPAGDAVRVGQRLELSRAAADQERLGQDARAVGELDPALGADRQDRADQVLVRAHAPGHAVHDDADPALRHVPPLLERRAAQHAASTLAWPDPLTAPRGDRRDAGRIAKTSGPGTAGDRWAHALAMACLARLPSDDLGSGV